MSEEWPVVDVWILHEREEILVTDLPGPPASICVFLSEEARQAALQRGHATVSEIGFAQDDHPGFFKGEGAWADALALARQKAEELGYRVVQQDSQFEEIRDASWEEYDEYDEDWWPEDDEDG